MIQQPIHHGFDVSIQRDTSNLMYRYPSGVTDRGGWIRGPGWGDAVCVGAGRPDPSPGRAWARAPWARLVGAAIWRGARLQ